MASIYIDIDTGRVKAMLDDMKSKLTVEQFDRLMSQSLRDVGKRMKKPIKDESVKYYEITPGFITKAIKPPKLEGGGGQWRCDIPLLGPKGHIGGTFKAEGGHYGWNPPKYKITAHIVKGAKSTLPDAMPSQGGQPPFRNVGKGRGGGTARKIGTLAMTRSGGGRFPIQSVSGLAAPQMPMNRARPEIERELLERLEERTTHYFDHLFG